MIKHDERLIVVETAEQLDTIVNNLIEMKFFISRLGQNNAALCFRIGVSHDPLYGEGTRYWILLDRSAVKELRKKRNYSDLLSALTKPVVEEEN